MFSSPKAISAEESVLKTAFSGSGKPNQPIRQFVHGRIGNFHVLDHNSAVDLNVLDKMRNQTVYKARQRRFAAAALSAKENKLSVVYRQIDVIQNSVALYCGAYILKSDHSRYPIHIVVAV